MQPPTNTTVLPLELCQCPGVEHRCLTTANLFEVHLLEELPSRRLAVAAHANHTAAAHAKYTAVAHTKHSAAAPANYTPVAYATHSAAAHAKHTPATHAKHFAAAHAKHTLSIRCCTR